MKTTLNAIHAERFFQQLPNLAIAGDEKSVDRIAYELLKVLMDEVDADIGQLNLLPIGGRVEKACIVKDGKPWMRADKGLHPYNPGKGFTGRVMTTGKTILVEDIWSESRDGEINPFLQIYPYMDVCYVAEIKKPVASTLILPIKYGKEIFCTIELSRYRGKQPFRRDEQAPLDAFAAQYGALIANYILDTKKRSALNKARHKLNGLSRLIASNSKIDYMDAVSTYRELSAADMGYGFFRRGSGYGSHPLCMVAWYRDEFREIYFPEFTPSADSVLCDQSPISYPVEGNGNCRRLHRFREKIRGHDGIKPGEKKFLLKLLNSIRSYVIYPLHMLDQDLGAIHLASSRNDFCTYLQMSPFLSLYNALLKSFLLNERVAEQLAEISLNIHNPGFYCLGALKTALIKRDPGLLADPQIARALTGLDDLLSDIHNKGKILKCRKRHIHLKKWLKAYINQKRAYYPNIGINLLLADTFPANCQVHSNYAQLETLFENLFANSIRAITEGQNQDPMLIGQIDLTLRQEKDMVAVCFQDNGQPYKTVSGRGTPQMRAIMGELGGSFKRLKDPFRVFLRFPYQCTTDNEA